MARIATALSAHSARGGMILVEPPRVRGRGPQLNHCQVFTMAIGEIAQIYYYTVYTLNVHVLSRQHCCYDCDVNPAQAHLSLYSVASSDVAGHGTLSFSWSLTFVCISTPN